MPSSLLRSCHSHAGIHALAILLVLQPCLSQVDGEHAGDPDQPSDATIDELGRQAVYAGSSVRTTILNHRMGGGWGGHAGERVKAKTEAQGLGGPSDLICLSAIYTK